MHRRHCILSFSRIFNTRLQCLTERYQVERVLSSKAHLMCKQDLFVSLNDINLDKPSLDKLLLNIASIIGMRGNFLVDILKIRVLLIRHVCECSGIESRNTFLRLPHLSSNCLLLLVLPLKCVSKHEEQQQLDAVGSQ